MSDAPVPTTTGLPLVRDVQSGRFLPGNRYGGNPAAGRIAALRAAVVQAVDPDEIRTALRTLYRLGVEEQSIPALVAWLGYVVGRPREGGLLAEVLQQEQRIPTSASEMLQMSDEELVRMLNANREST